MARPNGYVEDYNAAFSKYLSRGKPGYVERAKTSIHEATSAILRAKGIPVLAHPGRYKLNEWEFDCMFEEFTGAGGHAIEVTTGSHTPGQNLLFCDFAQSRNLWASTGSDFHRPMNRCEPDCKETCREPLIPFGIISVPLKACTYTILT